MADFKFHTILRDSQKLNDLHFSRLLNSVEQFLESTPSNRVAAISNLIKVYDDIRGL
jgi:hypothetical protein